jgi:polyhydroxybutyrate depolymerase
MAAEHHCGGLAMNFAGSWTGKATRAALHPLPAGSRAVNMTLGGLARQFIVHVPPVLPANAGAVIAFHGGGGAADALQAGIGMDAQADASRFVTVYPSAYGGNWTDGRASTVGGLDDVKFAQNIVAWLATHCGVSHRKIFATGISNGGLFCHWLAYQSPATVAGIATVAANIPDSYSSLITAQGPRMMFQGTSDPLMLFAGGVNAPLGPESMTSTLNSIGKYRTANGASAAVVTAMPDLDPADGCTVSRRDYPNGAAQTTAYIVTGGGHQWPGGNGAGVGNSTNDISATALMVAMFRTYGLY